MKKANKVLLRPELSRNENTQSVNVTSGAEPSCNWNESSGQVLVTASFWQLPVPSCLNKTQEVCPLGCLYGRYDLIKGPAVCPSMAGKATDQWPPGLVAPQTRLFQGQIFKLCGIRQRKNKYKVAKNETVPSRGNERQWHPKLGCWKWKQGFGFVCGDLVTFCPDFSPEHRQTGCHKLLLTPACRVLLVSSQTQSRYSPVRGSLVVGKQLLKPFKSKDPGQSRTLTVPTFAECLVVGMTVTAWMGLCGLRRCAARRSPPTVPESKGCRGVNRIWDGLFHGHSQDNRHKVLHTKRLIEPEQLKLSVLSQALRLSVPDTPSLTNTYSQKHELYHLNQT